MAALRQERSSGAPISPGRGCALARFAPGQRGTWERDQIVLLLAGQFRAKHQIEELDRIIERQRDHRANLADSVNR
jgi:hypothetical protein